MVSAGAILAVEISMRAEHAPRQADGLLRDAKKIVCWLRVLSRDNLTAERCWVVLSKLLIVSSSRIGGDTWDLEQALSGADLESALESRREFSHQGGMSHIPPPRPPPRPGAAPSLTPLACRRRHIRAARSLSQPH